MFIFAYILCLCFTILCSAHLPLCMCGGQRITHGTWCSLTKCFLGIKLRSPGLVAGACIYRHWDGNFSLGLLPSLTEALEMQNVLNLSITGHPAGRRLGHYQPAGVSKLGCIVKPCLGSFFKNYLYFMCLAVLPAGMSLWGCRMPYNRCYRQL